MSRNLTPAFRTGLLVGGLLVVVGLSIAYVLRSEPSVVQWATEKLTSAPEQFAFTDEVQANYLNRRFLDVKKAPARLHGGWESSRVQDKGGITNDLISFEIHAPNDQVLYISREASLGQFDIRLPVTGRYTIHMNNSGLLRSSPRSVTVRATLENR